MCEHSQSKQGGIPIALTAVGRHSVPAFINYNLTDDGLRHCVLVAKASMILYESDLASNIADVADALRQVKPDLIFVSWSDNFSSAKEKHEDPVSGTIALNPDVLRPLSRERIPDDRRKGITWQSPACLIYTSGQLVGVT